MNTVVNHWLQVNYVNTILYPVSVRNCPRPGLGVLCILIGDFTSKITLLLFTLLSVSNFPSPGRVIICIQIGGLTSKSALLLFALLITSKPHFEKRPVIVDPIKCKKTIHGRLLIILQSKSRGLVVYIDFVIIFMRLNNKR